MGNPTTARPAGRGDGLSILPVSAPGARPAGDTRTAAARRGETRPEQRQREGDRAMLRGARRQHGRYAAARLAVQREWAEADAAEAERDGDPERARDRGAYASRLGRVIRMLATGAGGAS